MNAPQIDEAARWLASLTERDRPSPIVPALAERYGLSPKQAVDAMREATLIRGRAL